jgi:adenosine deaminase
MIMLNPDYPRVDLHRHLEGCIRLETVLDINRTHPLGLPARDLAGLQQAVWMTHPIPDILEIMPRFDWLRTAFVDLDACRRVTHEVLVDAAAEGLDYAEIRFSPLFMAEPHHLDPLSVTSVVCEAWQEASRQLDFSSSLIVILSRTYGPQACEVELEAALQYAGQGISGLDLAGDEARHPAREFRPHFERARQAGLHLTAHAGEFAGAQSVWETVQELKPDRLGHAVRAADDGALLDLLAEKGIAVECCPTSNLLTASISNIRDHPLPVFLRSGICATLNTDDPSLFSNISLEHEYRLAAEEMGLSPEDLVLVQENGRKAAFAQNWYSPSGTA